MTFTVQDMIATLGGKPDQGFVSEQFSGEVASIEYNNLEMLRQLFPGEPFSDTASIAYVPSIFCNSYPSRNKRGRMFMPKVLSNSVASARDAMVNIDHMVSANGNGTREDIVGHVKAASFQWKETADLPIAPIPMHALNALYLRHPRVADIISEHRKNKSWLTSMECGHDMSTACFRYENEFIPVKDADQAMLECVKRNTVLPYKGRELSLCLGGEMGSVDFWGYALTQSPADTEAGILGIVSAGHEVASVLGKRKRYFPISFNSYDIPQKTSEAANAAVDKRITELASIAVIGKTEPAEDGHAHEVLSDGTIVPLDGHTHYLRSWSLARGTTPIFSGVTDTYSKYLETAGRSESVVHQHLVKINLRGKSSAPAGGEPDSEVSHFNEEDIMSTKALLTRVETLLTNLSTGKTGEVANSQINQTLITELNGIRTELSNTNLEADLQDKVKKEIANQLAAGTIVTAEVVATKVKEVEDKALADAAAAVKLAESKAKRLEKITALGVNLDSTPYEDSPEESIRARIDAIGFDEPSERIFNLELKQLTFLKEKITAATKVEAVAAEAASIAKAKKKVPFIIGAAETEVATAGASNGKVVGRFAVSK